MPPNKNKKNINLVEIGSTGLNVFSGLIFEEFLSKLRNWSQAVKVYMEMRDNSATIGAFLFAIDMLIRQASWPVIPFSSSDEDVQAALFVESIKDDMSSTWADTVSEILSMLVFGFSFHEIVYKIRLGPNQKNPSKKSRYNDGKIGIRKLPIRSQDTITQWIMDDNGGLTAIEQQAPPNYTTVIIPIEKGLLFRPKVHKGNPEGRSILRNAVRDWFFLKRIQEIEGIGIERDLAGFPLGYAPVEWFGTEAGTKEQALLRDFTKIVTDIRRDEQDGALIPSVFDENNNRLIDLKLLSSGGDRQFDTNDIVNRYKQDIAATVLADFILLGQQNVGSFALASSKTEIFGAAIGAWMDSIVEVFNRFMIPRLFTLNNFKVDNLPRLSHSDIESHDLEQLKGLLSVLFDAGMKLDRELENWIRTTAKMPERPTEEKVE